MFDEVDEATAIIQRSRTSRRAKDISITFDGLPPEWYLRLTGEGSKLIRRQASPPVECNSHQAVTR